MEDFRCAELCPHREFCGGCIYQGVSYEEQLKTKENEVLELLEKKGVVPERIDKIEGCPSQYGYRNKMEYTFGDFVKDGETTLGMHRKKNFMSIVTVDQCQLVDEDFNKILRGTLDFVNEKGYRFYHKRSHQGLMRNLIVRKGIRTGELLINIVTTSDSVPDSMTDSVSESVTDTESFNESEYVERLIGLDLNNQIVGILRTVNDNIADAVNCEELRILWGRDYYREKILGLDFKVSAFSFFQTNVEAVERLYTEALALVDSFEGKTAFDLYCGTGTISQILALRAKKALGIELVAEAVESAKANAKLNNLVNCDFIAGDVFEVLKSVDEKPDVIVVDPPRVGIQPKALDKIISYGVEEIIYISCNPKTLVENLKYMEYYGYKCKYLKPFDNFPMTKHIETICLMSRKGE